MPEKYPAAEILVRSDSSIHSLPSEILSHIFILGSEECLDDEFELDSNEDISDAHFATLCSHVCKYWRNVALETPHLWAYIDFEEGPPFEKSREWISRSKAVPLTLDIHHSMPQDSQQGSREGSEDSEDSEDSKHEAFTMFQQSHDVGAIRSLIMPHAHRWRSLEIVADHYEIIYLWVLQLENCPATPELEHLHLSCHEESLDEEQLQLTELRNPRSILPLGAPKLTTVNLWGVHIDWEAATFLRGLTALQLAYHTKDVRPSVEQFVHMLAQSPDMEDLSLEGSAPCLGDWPLGRISLKSLRTLAIVGVDVEIAIAIVDHLEFPALRDLTLDLDEDDSAEPFIAAVCKGNRPRFRDLEALKLTSFPCQHQAAVQFLKSMPNITSMTLNFNFLTKRFYDALVRRPVSSPIVCRRLNTLKLSGLDDKELRNLIATRKRSRDVASIQRLYLDQDDDLEDSTVEWLRKNVEHLEFYEPSDDEEDDEDSEEEDEDEED